jgi:hypothetical protein
MDNWKEQEEGTFRKLKSSFREIFGKPENSTSQIKVVSEEMNGKGKGKEKVD